MNIQEAIQRIAGTHMNDEVKLVVCEVTSVDEDKRTCTCEVIGGGASITLQGVKLMAEVDDGMLCIPAVESTVMVGYSKRIEPYVALFSELDKVHVTIGQNETIITRDKVTMTANDTAGIELTDGKVKINDGEHKGLVKVIELVQRLNGIENKLNDLILKYNDHIHETTATVGTGPVGVISPTNSTETELIPITKQSDLENTNVTHGSSL